MILLLRPPRFERELTMAVFDSMTDEEFDAYHHARCERPCS